MQPELCTECCVNLRHTHRHTNKSHYQFYNVNDKSHLRQKHSTSVCVGCMLLMTILAENVFMEIECRFSHLRPKAKRTKACDEVHRVHYQLSNCTVGMAFASLADCA